MIHRRLMFVATFVLGACAGRSAAVSPGPNTANAPVEAAPAGPKAAWYDTIRPLTTLSKGWNRIPGRYGTGCAHDSTFAFRVRPGLTDKVMIFLNGGGACWRAAECDPHGKPTYTMSADSANDVSVRTGLFDVANPLNPVRDYTMVFIPYCTGDVHLGTRLSEYQIPRAKGAPRTFAVRHGGAANIEAVLDWVYTNLKTPSVVFVAGVNAGAIPSPVIASRMARHYPRARVVQLGDGAGGYHASIVPSLMAGWGATEYLQTDPAFRMVDSADFNFEQLYISSARAAPKVHFAQVNTVEDATQLFFLTLLGVKGTPLAKLLATDIAEVRNVAPWFRTYTAPGKAHAILWSNALYTTTVDKVLFRDWLEELLNGESVNDVGEKLLIRKR
ncbi:MAG: pectin acetylesterase-family hydrolase [bacterium]